MDERRSTRNCTIIFKINKKKRIVPNSIKQLASNIRLLKKKEGKWFQILKRLPGYYQLRSIFKASKKNSQFDFQQCYLRFVNEGNQIDKNRITHYNHSLLQLLQQKQQQRTKTILNKFKIQMESIEKHYNSFVTRRNHLSSQKFQKQKKKLIQSVFGIAKSKNSTEEYELFDSLQKTQEQLGPFPLVDKLTRTVHKKTLNLACQTKQLTQQLLKQYLL